MLLGIGGSGGASFDAHVLGGPELSPRERADRFAEFAELLDLLLRTDHVSWLAATTRPSMRGTCPAACSSRGFRSSWREWQTVAGARGAIR
jgi:hypothetical protein